MASKYLQKFPVPKQFPEILHDFSREILREQPGDIILFAAEYFKAASEGRAMKWDDPQPRAPKPSDYPRVKGEKVLASHRSKASAKPTPRAPPAEVPTVRQDSSSASRPQSQVSAKSAGSAASEAAKEYLSDVLEKIFDKLIESQ